MTGMGRGMFNLYVGGLLFLSKGDKQSIGNIVMGIAMLGAGCIFVFLSKFKQISDDEIIRAVSVQKKSVYNFVGNQAKENEGAIK